MTSGDSGPPDGEVAFEYGGSRYTMVFDMKAIAFFEREADMSIVEILGDLDAAKREKRAPKLAGLAFLMQAGLRRHHPEVTPERALRMAGDPAVQAALGSGVGAAMPDPAAEPGGAASAEGNAPAASKPKRSRASTGTRRSKGRSKPG